jgi:hypothetical protein
MASETGKMIFCFGLVDVSKSRIQTNDETGEHYHVSSEIPTSRVSIPNFLGNTNLF